MDFIHYEFDATASDFIEVTLDRAANVQLLDPANFDRYQKGLGFRYSGGYATSSPVQLPVPHPGHWHVIIDLGGGAGRVRASARLVTGAAV